MNADLLLFSKALVSHPSFSRDVESEAVSIDGLEASKALIGTLVNNMAYYGYRMSSGLLSQVSRLSEKELMDVCKTLKSGMEHYSGSNLNADSVVLYKNFPKEVMDMSESEYWIRQICVYLGCPHDFVREEVKSRPEIDIDLDSLKIIDVCYDKKSELETIYGELVGLTTSWTDQQNTMVSYLENILSPCLNLSSYGFKKNGLSVILRHINKDKSNIHMVEIPDATDVLRLSAMLYDADVDHNNMRFGNLSRSMRRAVLAMLENSKNLESDVSMRQQDFKRLLSYLHPNDFKFKRVSAVYDDLYNDRIKTYHSDIEKAIVESDDTILKFLETRSGEMIRRFHKLYEVFGEKAVNSFVSVAENVDTNKLIAFKSYISTINTKKELLFPNGGNWSHPTSKENTKVKIAENDQATIVNTINSIVGSRITASMGQGFAFDESLKRIKLQANDQKFAEYGRGTSFDFPKDADFARTMSFWANNEHCYVDNSISVYKEDWKHVADCCWDETHATLNGGLVFSGDASNSQDPEGRAAQFIDINFDALRLSGVRYVVWSLLSFNHINFSNIDLVHGGIQFGNDKFKGQIFEPSRIHMSFPVTSNSTSVVVAYLDIVYKKIVYLDMPLRMPVRSIGLSSQTKIKEIIPKFKDLIEDSPSLYDLLEGAYQADGIPAVYTDKYSPIVAEKGFVFIPKNENTAIDEKVSIESLIKA